MRRALKVASLVLLGAVLSAAGFAAWYHWGRASDSPTQVTDTALYSGSGTYPGLTITRCEIAQSGNDALAYGIIKNHSLPGGQAIEMAVYNARDNIIGYAYNNYPDTSAGAYWQLDAHVTQGLGPVKLCRVGFTSYIAHPFHP